MSDDEQHDFQTEVAGYVTKKLHNLAGFVLLDEKSRYKIIMSNGWPRVPSSPETK